VWCVCGNSRLALRAGMGIWKLFSFSSRLHLSVARDDVTLFEETIGRRICATDFGCVSAGEKKCRSSSSSITSEATNALRPWISVNFRKLSVCVCVCIYCILCIIFIYSRPQTPSGACYFPFGFQFIFTRVCEIR